MNDSVFLPSRAPFPKTPSGASTQLPLCRPTFFHREPYPAAWQHEDESAIQEETLQQQIDNQALREYARAQAPARIHRNKGAGKQTTPPEAASHSKNLLQAKPKAGGNSVTGTKRSFRTSFPKVKPRTPELFVLLPSGAPVTSKVHSQLLGWELLLQTLPVKESKVLRTIVEEGKDEALETILHTFCKGEAQAKHLAHVLRYHTWALTIQQEPTSEQALYKYLKHCLKENKAATHAASMVSALKYFYGKAEYHAGLLTTTSARVERIKQHNTDRKDERREAAPLPVQTVVWMEHEISMPSTTPEVKSILGFFLWCVYARYRAGEAARLRHEPKSEDIDHPDAFLSCNTKSECTKTGQKAHRRGHVMCILAKAKGIAHEVIWSKHWLEAREALGQNADTDECLQQDVDHNLHPIQGTIMTTTKCTRLMRLILGEQLVLDGSHPGKISSHTCKGTTLTWCTKRGMRAETRNLLGYHAKSKLEMKDLYGKDAFFWPVHALGCILIEIREGIFEPDAPRHLRLPPNHKNPDLQKYLSPSGTEASAITAPVGEAAVGPLAPTTSALHPRPKAQTSPSSASTQLPAPGETRKPSAWPPKPEATHMGQPEAMEVTFTGPEASEYDFEETREGVRAGATTPEYGTVTPTDLPTIHADSPLVQEADTTSSEAESCHMPGDSEASSDDDERTGQPVTVNQLRLELLSIAPLQANAQQVLLRKTDGSVHYNDGYGFPRCLATSIDKRTKLRAFTNQFAKVVDRFVITCEQCQALSEP